MSLPQQARVSDRTGRAGATVAPFQIRGRFFTALVLHMGGAPDDAFYEALDSKLAQAAQFFVYVPLVLDLEKAAGRAIDFADLLEKLRARKLTLIGVQNCTAEHKRAALEAGLIPLQGGRDMPVESEKRNGAEAPVVVQPPAGAPSLLVTEPVRSGQRIFADGGDLVIVASVGSGAEVIARGNIHIYGKLRGRALAGANGDTNARIFCQSLEAELVAIAGVYKTSDDLLPWVREQRAQVFLSDDALRIEPLK